MRKFMMSLPLLLFGAATVMLVYALVEEEDGLTFIAVALTYASSAIAQRRAEN